MINTNAQFNSKNNNTPINAYPLKPRRNGYSESDQQWTITHKAKKILQPENNENSFIEINKNTNFYDIAEVIDNNNDIKTISLGDKSSKEIVSPQKQSSTIDKLKIDFEEGDLVYGLSRSRLKFLERNFDDLEDRTERLEGNELISGHKNPVAIDTINNLFLGTGAEILLMTNQQAKKMSKEERKILNSYNPEKKVTSPQAKKFKNFLKTHKKYNPTHCSESQDSQLRIGRACKGGLEYTTTITNKKIHFVLDGIDFSRIMDDIETNKKNRDITGKELRWIYRHRKDPNIINKIIFYKDNVVTTAPWKSDKELWGKYKVELKNRKIN